MASLLAHITRINWSSDMNDSRASGEVLGSKRGVQRFDLSSTDMSDFEITQRLWQMME